MKRWMSCVNGKLRASILSPTLSAYHSQVLGHVTSNVSTHYDGDCRTLNQAKYKGPGIRDAFSSGKNGCEILRVISIDVFVHFFIEYLHDLQVPKWFHPQPLRDSQGWTQKLMDQLKYHIHFPEVGAHRQHHMVLPLLNVLQSYSNLENLEAQLRSCALFSAPLLTPHGHEEKEEQEHESFSRRPLSSPPLTAHHLRPPPHDYLNSPGLAAVYTSSTTQGTRWQPCISVPLVAVVKWQGHFWA